jgi:hypothetical protein
VKKLLPILLLMPILLFAQTDDDGDSLEAENNFFANIDSTLSNPDLDGPPFWSSFANWLRFYRNDQSTSGTPFLLSWTKNPEAQMKAEVRKINVNAKFSNNFIFQNQNMLTVSAEYSQDDYRRQDKIVERRKGNLSYSNQDISGFKTTLNMSDNWSENTITNSGGVININKSDVKQTSVGISRDGYQTGDISHDIKLNGKASNQSAIMQNQLNDHSEAQINAGVASAYKPRDWLSLHTGVYAMAESGDRALGQETNPSSAGGDSLRVGAFYTKPKVSGGFTVKHSSFDNRYLDYRRNTNGIIDTIGATEKIVQELETKDAISLEWKNKLQFSHASLQTTLARDISENSFQASSAGKREKQQDKFNLTMGIRITKRDSIKVTYGWFWKWNDQTYQGAINSRGKQISRRRDFAVDWNRDLFKHTTLRSAYTTSLSQEIAEGDFNTNDRDRLDTSLNSKMETRFDNGISVSLVFDYKHVEDLSIKREKSSNNNIKDSYEISPGYHLPIASWLEVNQNYRVWIQYTDYIYSFLESVNRDDGYNKRGNLNTEVIIKPNERLKVILKHDYNIKINATGTSSDVSGTNYYNRDQEQKINKVDFSVSYKATDWLALDLTTYKTRDEKIRLGATSTPTDRLSGDIKFGCIAKHDFGTGKSINATVGKVYAHGPNVQEYNSEYWDADIKFSWRF